MVNNENFKKQLASDALTFRQKKIKEVLAKPENQRIEMEVSIIQSWIEHYGNAIY